MRMRSGWLSSATLLALLGAAPILATDGVIEINQAKVVANGGFPFTISQPGSYRLTSNLTAAGVAGPGTNLVVINANNVSLDLNGFAIIGLASIGSPTVTSTGVTTPTRIYNGTLRDCINTGNFVNLVSVDDVVVINSVNNRIYATQGRVARANVVGSNTCIIVSQGEV